MSGQITTFEMSADSQELVRALEAVPLNGIITWNELSERIGRNVQAEARGTVETARRHLRDDSKILFEVVRGVGLKRMGVSQVVKAILPETNTRIRRLVKRQGKKLGTVSEADYGALPKEDQTTYNTARAHLGTLAEIVKDKTIKKLTKATEDSGKPLPLAKTLEVFAGK